MEVLRCRKPLIAVANDGLMNQHQSELAEALEEEGYLLSCRPEELLRTLCRLPSTHLRLFPDANDSAFAGFLDQVLFPVDAGDQSKGARAAKDCRRPST